MEMKDILAKNLIENRKRLKLTQAELAEKINFSDKSISKWERGDGVPDLETMVKLAEFFGTSVDSLISENMIENKKKVKGPSKNSKIFIPILSVGLALLIGITLFVVFTILAINFPAWLFIIYSISASAIVLIVFSAMWGKFWQTATCISILCWTLILSVFLTFKFTNSWLLFIAGIPLQVLVILWFIFRNSKVKGDK